MKSLIDNVSIMHLVAVLAVVLFAGMALFGCKTLPQENTARLAVSFAVAKYIEKAGSAGQIDRARRVLKVVNAVDDFLAGDVDMTVASLKAYVLGNIPDSLSPVDRALAVTLLDIAVAELTAQIGDGTGPLKPEAKLRVRAVLKWIASGTDMFLPDGE